MKIFVKKNVDIQRQMQKKIAPVTARAELQENISTAKKHASGFTDDGKRTSLGIRDKQEALREQRKWEKAYERSSPETLSPEAKNTMWRKAKQLKDEFTEGMLSRDELHPVRKFEHGGVIRTVVDYDKLQLLNSVKREQAWNTKNENKVREFKNIMRHLCPDDPNAGDVEKFRVRRSSR